MPHTYHDTFELTPEDLDRNTHNRLINGTATITISPADKTQALDGSPFRDLYIDQYHAGRFETYTQACEHIIWLVNDATPDDNEDE